MDIQQRIKYMNQKLIKLKADIDKSPVTVGNVNTTLSATDLQIFAN